jgi:hypothetical protein
MRKETVVTRLGGTVSKAARAINITPSAFSQWPDELPPRLADRVLAALVRLRPDDWMDIWPELAHSQQQGGVDGQPGAQT